MATTVVSTPEPAGWLVPYALNVTLSITPDGAPWTVTRLFAERSWDGRMMEVSS